MAGLNEKQMEEVRQITQGKMRQFRRDRLYASDRDRILYFNQLLKQNRISDDQQNYGGVGGSSKTGGKNYDGHGTKGVSPTKVSPNKQSQGTKFNDSSHTNNA